MAEGTNGRRRFSDKWGKHELDVLAVLSSAFPQWLTSRQIAQRVKAYADSYGELADQAAKAAFSKQFQRDRAKLAAMGIAIESRQPEYSSKSEGQDFASYRLQLGDESRVRLQFEQDDLPVLAAANYLARSISLSSTPIAKESSHHASRTAPRVPQTPVPGLGLESIAPGLGIESLPEKLREVLDERHFAATLEVNGQPINVAYTNSDDLAMYMLEQADSHIVNPCEALEAFKRRLHAAAHFAPIEEVEFAQQKNDNKEQNVSVSEPGDPESLKAFFKRTPQPFQTGSEVDRRLRLMLFLSAHIGEEFHIEELVDRFIGKPRTEDERKKRINIIFKDISTLTTVSDDGEMAGSQFFDIDWVLFEDENIVCATNSLGLERLAGISQQYLSMLIASVKYLAHSVLLDKEKRAQAENLYNRLIKHIEVNKIPWISLTGFEIESFYYSHLKEAIEKRALIEIWYTKSNKEERHKIVAPIEVYNEEGKYFVHVETDVKDYLPKDFSCDPSLVEPERTVNKEEGIEHTRKFYRVARIKNLRIITPTTPLPHFKVIKNLHHRLDFSDSTEVSFVIDKPNENFDKFFTGNKGFVKKEPCGKGEKFTIKIFSDSWFVAFCIAHARHILAVGPEKLRTQISERVEKELDLIDNRHSKGTDVHKKILEH